jgi:hypothetical protein
MIYLYVGTVYYTHPRRPLLVRSPVCQIIEVSLQSLPTQYVGQVAGWTREAPVTANAIQSVAVGRPVLPITGHVSIPHHTPLSAQDRFQTTWS